MINIIMKLKILMLIFVSIMFSVFTMINEIPLFMWMSMEISNITLMMAIILISPINPNVPALLLITQFFSSSLMLMSIIKNVQMFMALGLMIKLGLFPGHNWIPMVVWSSPWKLILVILTIPKITPFILMDSMSDNFIIIISICMTTIIVSIKLIQINTPKMIMAMSSMIHSSWMVMAQMISFKSWITYFTLYSFNTAMVCSMMPYMNANYNKKMKMFILMIMFSLIATPPMTSLMGKMYLLYFTEYSMLMPLIILVMSSSISLLFYSRMFLKMIYLHTKTNKINFSVKFKPSLWIMFMMTLFLII